MFSGVHKQRRREKTADQTMHDKGCLQNSLYTLGIKAVTQPTGLYTTDRNKNNFRSCYASYCTTNLSCKKTRIYTKRAIKPHPHRYSDILKQYGTHTHTQRLVASACHRLDSDLECLDLHGVERHDQWVTHFSSIILL